LPAEVVYIFSIISLILFVKPLNGTDSQVEDCQAECPR